jgi:hypothetical protein
MRRDFRGHTEGRERELVEGDLADIDSCDAVLADFTHADEGTAMEAWYAHAAGTRSSPTQAVCPPTRGRCTLPSAYAPTSSTQWPRRSALSGGYDGIATGPSVRGAESRPGRRTSRSRSRRARLRRSSRAR